MLGALASVGCADKFRDRKPAMMLSDSDVDQYIAIATNDPSADERRGAVKRLGKSKQLTDQSVIETLIDVATTDESAPVRATAMLVLDQSESPQACDAALAILREDTQQKLPVDNDSVRSAAIKTIRHCVDENRAAAEELASSVALAGEVVEKDRSRHVRLEAVRMLGCFPKREALDVLISALSQRDFGICYEAEKSLHRLTGESYDCNADDWRIFVSGTANPFANAPEDMPQQTADKRSWFDWNR